MNNVKKSIGWCDYTINPVKGLCPMACPYCYARRMYKRFKWNPEIRMEPDWQEELPKKPARVFVGSTIELFGKWIPPEWMAIILGDCKILSQHTFIFLTKQPENLRWWQFPDNCWVGVSATNLKQYRNACVGLTVIQSKVRFISFEPLLERIPQIIPTYELSKEFVDWVIIGQQTPIRKATMPKVGWIQEIVEACDKANIPVFLKNNLELALPFNEAEWAWARDGYATRHSTNVVYTGKLRQEFPSA
jgi:protein gp37